MIQRYAGEGKAVIQLVLPVSWVARINSIAIERGTNRSALIREAIVAVHFTDETEASVLGNQERVGGGDQ